MAEQRTSVDRWIADDESEVANLARAVGHALKAGDCLALSGELGAGKSTFARALIRAVAGDAEIEVPSPTFTLVQTYELVLPIHHFDLYRLIDPGEVEELGLEEALTSGVALVEWPERAGEVMPSDSQFFRFDEIDDQPNARTITLNGSADFIARVRRSEQIGRFLKSGGWGDAHRTPFQADASARRYEMVSRGDQRRILMDAPRLPDGEPIRDDLPYSAIAHLAEDVTAFVAIGKELTERGFAAPQIDFYDLEAGLVLLEHLGSEGLLDGSKRPIIDRYKAAAQCLAEIRTRDWSQEIQLSSEVTYQVPAFDLTAFLIETELLIDWYVERKTGQPPTEAMRKSYLEIWAELYEVVGACGETLLLRDYHSPNVIWRGDKEGSQRVGLIDFQDALIGSPAYDVMSLVYDARVDLDPDASREIFDAYCEVADSIVSGFDRNAFEKEAAILAAQRTCKILGIFVRLDERDGKPAYLQNIPRVRNYLLQALKHPVLAKLSAWFNEHDLLTGEIV